MPLTNRVDPFGVIFATPHKGAWMGNRGRLHDARKQVVRRWAGKTWITCALAFRDYRRRELMAADSYTELFFLDEATAYAAGHRPCAECRRADYNAFKAAFAAARPADDIRAALQMDVILHAERTAAVRARAPATALPDGAMIALGGQAFLKLGDGLRPWTPGGYGPARSLPGGEVEVLTPPAILAVLRAGLPVQIHGSAQAG
jgi:hypothetical protein